LREERARLEREAGIEAPCRTLFHQGPATSYDGALWRLDLEA
jgi:hypothetical protein